jgi:hypothetical protein
VFVGILHDILTVLSTNEFEVAVLIGSEGIVAARIESVGETFILDPYTFFTLYLT